MNNRQLVEKVIKCTNEESLPELVYENPLLDASVTSTLSKSFLKILNISDRQKSVNNNLRHSILQSIRKLCTVEPEGHARIDENVTESLTDLYSKNIAENNVSQVKSVKKALDAFLSRKIIGLQMKSCYESFLNPEVAKAMMNLNQYGSGLDAFSTNIILWDSNDKKCASVVMDLWSSDSTATHLLDDLALKMKPQIERELLKLCYTVMEDEGSNLDALLSSSFLTNLLKKSAVSPGCFQMCTSIVNFIFIMTNFNDSIQILISRFLKDVKSHSSHLSFSVLYTTHLRHLVLLLDFDIDLLPESLKGIYIEHAIKYLNILHKESENDLILILSHFSQWFDIYFKFLECNNIDNGHS